MFKEIESCVFDLDETIIDKGAPLSEAIDLQLLKLREKKHLIFATGRSFFETCHVLPKHYHHHPMACSNGANIILNQKKIQENETFKNIHYLIDNLNAANLPLLLNNGQKWCTINHIPQEHWQFLDKHKKFLVPHNHFDIESTNSILVFSQLEKSNVKHFLDNEKLYYQTYSNFNAYNIYPKITTKALGIEALGFNLSRCACFGNDVNDLSMLKAAKYSVTVGPLLLDKFNPHAQVTHVNDMPIFLKNFISKIN